MPAITGVKEVLRSLDIELRRKVRRLRGTTEVTVGYTSNYALYVHESIEMKWKGKKRIPRIIDGVKVGGKGNYWDPAGQGQAKFLEQPAREKAGRMGEIISTAVKNGANLSQALLLAGLFLQRESQKLVPVDTGNLKNSASTRLDK